MYSHRRFSGRSGHLFGRTSASCIVGGSALLLSTIALLAFPRAVRAQTGQANTVSVTYLNTKNQIETDSALINANGVASLGISSNYLQDVAVQNGSEFIVEPIVDPRLDLGYAVTNLSGITFFNLRFTFPSADLKIQDSAYFDSADRFLSNVFTGPVTFEDPLLDPNTGGLSTEFFQTVVFNPLAGGNESLPSNSSGLFNLSIHIPGSPAGTPFYGELRPNNQAIQPITPLAPEPGSLALLCGMLGPAACMVTMRRQQRLRSRAAAAAHR